MNKIVYNPMMFTTIDNITPMPTVDVLEYPIAEAAKGVDGEPMWDANMGNYRSTGRTLEVSVKRGEAVEFEGYIADVLLDRYGFLQERTKEKTKNVKDGSLQSAPEENIVAEPKEEVLVGEAPASFVCRGCQKTFNASDELGLHMGMKHPELLKG